MSEFQTVLVANRGEIAVRVMRTARALGYRTVAVYSDIDRGSPHARFADRAVPIGPAPAAQSYLAIEKVIAAAKRSGADAIHPGYGFLSENAAFAEACADEGIVFIGPLPETIALMGNKAAAKRRMIEAGVPCVPGYDGDQDDGTLKREALAIGLPVMIKAAAGGGGKGMRLVADPARIEEALRAARLEAEKAFGSGELILEQAIAAPRHVEIQIFADRHRNVIHLGERDCSIQRRHQKVIEEAPSPALSTALHDRMGETAVAAAKAIGYVGAGTIEFLLAPDEKFYFLEMNTRLQVEHPVTELVTGIDLVEWQLRVAAGEPLPLRQRDVTFRGHAIEARLCAEDTHGDFLPQAGTLLAFEPPVADGVRVDHGLAAGTIVSPHYDPMMAKLIAHGATREEARRRLVSALTDLVVLGVETNRGFLIDCLRDEAFRESDVSTAFIATRFPADRRKRRAPGGGTMALAAVLIDRDAQVAVGEPLRHWRNAGAESSPLMLGCAERRIAMQLVRLDSGAFRVGWQDESHEIEIIAMAGNCVRFLADGLQQSAHFAFDRDVLHLTLDGLTATFADVQLARPDAREGSAGTVALAPMTGTIAAVHVASGDTVRKGQCLIILEAMKMQHEILAPRDGIVATVLVTVGQQVTARKILVELAEEGAPSP